MTDAVNSQRFYRLPWSMPDNGISWLEVTARCNLACQGCYRDAKSGRDKTLDEISYELSIFKKYRRSDCMSIAGGDPLVHPEIVEIVRRVKAGGWKPIINTNGVALTPSLLSELKRAGVAGFTFHIDTSQKRPHLPQPHPSQPQETASEAELNATRLHYAKMLAWEGGLACSFNQTVTSDTLDQVPEVVRWATRHPDIVHTVVFILYREPRLFGEYDFFVHGKKIPLAETYKKTRQWGGDRPLRAQDVMEKIREADPLYEPCAYLNGTEDPSSFKWLLATRIGNEKTTFGYASPAFMEAAQVGHRILHRKWLSYSHPRYLKAGLFASLAMSAVDPGMRRVLKAQLRQPQRLLKGSYLQTFTIIQPIDILADGRMSMCDACPDITVHNGKLVWSCRLEELKTHGAFATAAPKARQINVTAPEIFASVRGESSEPVQPSTH